MTDKDLAPKEESTAKEVAKAAQEVGKAVVAVAGIPVDVSKFLLRLFGPTAKDAVGLLGADWLSEYRRYRVAVFANRFNQKLAELGITETKSVPPKVAVPLIEKVSLEDNDDLLEMWSNLLAASVDPDCGFKPEAHYIEILGQLGAADASLLKILWLHSEADRCDRRAEEFRGKVPADSEANKKRADDLEAEALIEKESKWRTLPLEQQKIAIHNTIRLRLTNFAKGRISTEGLFYDGSQNLAVGPRSQFGANNDSKINPRKLERLVQTIDWETSVSSGWMEPEVFQRDDQNPDPYSNPERGMHLIASGFFLMRACNQPKD